jgi:Ca2+/Na+ antiporter
MYSEGFYTLLRIIVTVASCYIIYLEFVKKNIFFYLFVSTAVLFNPIIQLHFRRNTWQTIDVLTIFLFIVYLIYIFIKFIKAKDTNV